MRLARLLPLLLAACADAPPPSSAAPSGAPAGLTLSAGGLGGLGAATPFTPDAVRQAVGDGVTVEPGPPAGAPALGAPPAETLWVLRDGLLLAEVVREVRMAGGDGPTRVEVVGEGVPGPGGAEIGQAFSETGVSRGDCAVGTDALAGSAVCDADGVSFVFAHTGDPAALPSGEALAEALLTRMVWRAR